MCQPTTKTTVNDGFVLGMPKSQRMACGQELTSIMAASRRLLRRGMGYPRLKMEETWQSCACMWQGLPFLALAEGVCGKERKDKVWLNDEAIRVKRLLDGHC